MPWRSGRHALLRLVGSIVVARAPARAASWDRAAWRPLTPRRRGHFRGVGEAVGGGAAVRSRVSFVVSTLLPACCHGWARSCSPADAATALSSVVAHGVFV